MKHPNGSILVFACALAILFGCAASNSFAASSASAASKEDALLRAAITNRLTAIEADGQPVTLEGLNKFYSEPAPGDNAAALYQQAFDALTGNAKSPSFLAQNQKTLTLLSLAAARSSCRYPVDLREGASAKLPHLAKLKTCASLLEAEMTNQMNRGQAADACKAFLTDISLARSLENEPILISRLVEIASIRIGLDGLERAISRRPFTEQQLVKMQAALKTVEDCGSFHKAIVGEQCMAIHHFTATASELKAAFLSDTNAQSDGATLAQLTNYLKSATYPKDFLFALDYFSNLVATCAMPFPQCLSAPSPSMDDPAKNGYQLSAMLLPAIANSFVKGAEITARVKMAETALAIERYRLAHAGTLPATLADIVPTFLDSIPTDPMDGKPLRYKKLPATGYVVYSIGKDRKDDNGVPLASDGKTQLDCVMSIKR